MHQSTGVHATVVLEDPFEVLLRLSMVQCPVTMKLMVKVGRAVEMTFSGEQAGTGACGETQHSGLWLRKNC